MNSAGVQGLPAEASSHGRITSMSPPVARPFAIVALFGLLHLVLALTVDLHHAEIFLRADRATQRLDHMMGLLSVSSPSELQTYLSTHGILGDYGAHALLFLAGGRFAIVFVQVLLALASGLCVHRVATLLGLPAKFALVAMAVYLCMPHTLVFPHQLASEGLHVPFFVFSTWLLVEALFSANRIGALVCGGLCLGIATLIRPITLLWPFVAALALLILARPRAAAVYAGVALLPVIAWMSFIAATTGHFGLGKSAHSMESNLYERAVRIAATLPQVERDAALRKHLQNPDRELGPVAYLRFALDYPGASLEHVGRDTVTFLAKSGVERVTIDYLGLSPDRAALQDPRTGWRVQLEQHGVLHTAGVLWNSLGVVLLVSVVGAALTVMLFVLAGFAVWQYTKRWRDIRDPRVLTGLVLACVVGYTYVFSQVLNAMQSRQRAPAEFALVLLAAAGVYLWNNRAGDHARVARA